MTQTLIAQFRLATASDVKAAAQRARLLATLVDLSHRTRTQFGRVVQCAGQTVIDDGAQGTVEYALEQSKGQMSIVAIIRSGHREADLFASLSRTLQSETADGGVALQTQSNGVVRVSAEISSDYAEYSDLEVAEWAGILRTRRIQSVLASASRRTHELAEQLAIAQRQRQELETELQQSKSINETLTLLSLVASKTDNAVAIMDESGRITWVNDAFIRMTGYSVKDAAGQRPDLLLRGDETSTAAVEEIQRSMRDGLGVTEEFLQYRRNGTTSWIQLSLTPVHDDDGTVRRWIGIGADITRRREAQQSLQNARDAAEKASHLKGEFLTNISHEIRTPMNAIIGMTDLALTTELNAEQEEYLTTVRRSAESLLELLNDVLDLSRIESGRMELEAHATQVSKLLSDSLRPLQIIAGRKNLTFRWNVAEGVPEWVVADALRLRQVLVNLAGNAVKFTEAGHVQVDVLVDDTSENHRQLCFRIADTGIGITREKQSRIFDAFTQADATVTRQFGGTGLGLAISMQLAQLMDGSLTVSSEENVGSTFTCSIPLKLPLQNQIPPLSATAERRRQIAGRASRPLRVLVADDHEANRVLMAKILGKRGHIAEFAVNGREAVELYQKHPFDVVLMDVQMPGTDGYQATREIRSLERELQTHVPMIAVTAHAMQREREACLAAGMDAWLTKPVSAADLLTLVESLEGNQVNLSPETPAYIMPAATVPDEAVLTADTPPEEGSRAPRERRTFSAALERLDNDPELLLEQMRFFLNDGPALLQMLNEAVRAKDSEQRRMAAHRLKNLCATFDDDSTAQLCVQLEFSDGLSDASAVAALANRVDGGVRQLLVEIRDYLRD